MVFHATKIGNSGVQKAFYNQEKKSQNHKSDTKNWHLLIITRFR